MKVKIKANDNDELPAVACLLTTDADTVALSATPDMSEKRMQLERFVLRIIEDLTTNIRKFRETQKSFGQQL